MIPSTSQSALPAGGLPNVDSSTLGRVTMQQGQNGAATSASIANANRLQTHLNQGATAQAEMLMYEAMLETVQRNLSVEQSLENDVATVEAVNAQANEINDRVLPLLQSLTGQSLGDDPQPWLKWWNDRARICL